MPVEKRTRVELFIPIRTDSADYQAVTEWIAEELAYARGGSTLTTPFTGLYASATHGEIVRDDIHIIFCDFDLDPEQPSHYVELTDYLDQLRLLLMEALNEEEVWIVFYTVTRVKG